MAGIRTVKEIFAPAPFGFDITVFGAEPHGNYNRGERRRGGTQVSAA